MEIARPTGAKMPTSSKISRNLAVRRCINESGGTQPHAEKLLTAYASGRGARKRVPVTSTTHNVRRQ